MLKSKQSCGGVFGPRDICDRGEFIDDVKPLLFGDYFSDLIKYLYSPVVVSVPGPRGPKNRSGAMMWNDVIRHDSKYYIPGSEARIIRNHETYLKQLFPDPAAVVELGPGNASILEKKTIPMLRSLNAHWYKAFDLNKQFALCASEVVSEAIPGIRTSYVNRDFTEPYHLSWRGRKVDHPVLMAMFGGTLAQFPFSSDVKPGETSLKELLLNFGDMVDHNAIMLATTDTNEEDAVRCYKGAPMAEFQCHLFRTMKAYIEHSSDRTQNYVAVEEDVSEDVGAAVAYRPRQNGDGVIHSFEVLKPITISIEGELFNLDQGRILDIGVSERWDIESVIREIGLAGWEVVNDLESGDSMHALILAGEAVPEAQKERAEMTARELCRQTAAQTAVTARTVAPPAKPVAAEPIRFGQKIKSRFETWRGCEAR